MEELDYEYDAEAAGANCAACPLREARAGGPVPSKFFDGTLGVIVAEAPGGDEVKRGEPLVGPSGIELGKGLSTVGSKRSQWCYVNALSCQPPKLDGKQNNLRGFLHRLEKENKTREKQGREKIPTPFECCRPRFVRDLCEAYDRSGNRGALNVIALGATALHNLTGRSDSIQAVRGGPQEHVLDDLPLRILPTVHPAFVLRARRWTEAFHADLGRAVRWFETGLGWKDPKVIYRPNAAQLRGFLAHARKGRFVVIDVETAPGFASERWDMYDPNFDKLRCVGICTEDGDHVVVVPFRSKVDPAGIRFYAFEEARELVGILREFFQDPKILFAGWNHGSYDFMVIRRHFGQGFKNILDGIGLHKFASPELPHDLGYAGSVYTDVHSWKQGHVATEAETDEELWKYNCLAGTARVVLPDGTTREIADLVRRRYRGKVLGLDKAGRITETRVLGWTRRRVPNQQWIEITTAGGTARTTPDHPVLTRAEGQEWTPAEKLSGAHFVALPERRLSRYQHAAILGSACGDGSILVSPSYRRAPHTAPSACFAVGHTDRRLVEFKAAVIGVPVRRRAGRSGYRPSRAFWTIDTGNLVQLRGLIERVRDRKMRRRLPLDLLDEMGFVGLAWWFMDDGCRQNGARRTRNTGARGGRLVDPDGITLAACRYPQEDIDRVLEWLRRHFGPGIWVGKDKVFRFNAASAGAFCRTIAPHVPPFMRYKFPRGGIWPEFEPPEREPAYPTWTCVEASPVHPPRGTKQQRLRAETIFCLTTETGNFFTSAALVHNSMDNAVTARVIPTLLRAVKERGQEKAYRFWQRVVQPTCVGLHTNGLPVDEARRLEWDRKLVGEALVQRKILREIAEGAGRRFRNFNPLSTAQIRDLLFDTWDVIPHDYTALGDPSTGDDSLREFIFRGSQGDEVSPEQVRFLKALRIYREKTKWRGTYVTKLRRLGDDEIASDLAFDEEETEEDREKYAKRLQTSPGRTLSDGRVHPDWLGHGTVGWRLSSSKPNGQNFPPALRDIVKAKPGRLLIGCDQAQLELRFVAALANDRPYLEDFASGADPHYKLCVERFGDVFLKAPKDKQKELRVFVKQFTYGSLYRAEDETKHRILSSAESTDQLTGEEKILPWAGISLSEVAALSRIWLDLHPAIPAWWEELDAEFQRKGFLAEPIFGQRCDFLDGDGGRSSDGGGDASGKSKGLANKLANFKPQSGGAALVHLATERLLTEIPFEKWGPGTGLILNGHDQLVLEVPDDGHAPHWNEKGKPLDDAEFGWCPPGCRCTANEAARFLEECMTIDGRPWGLPTKFLGEASIGRDWAHV